MDEFVMYLSQHACYCIQGLPDDDSVGMLTHFAVKYGRILICEEVEPAHMFYRMHRTWPTEDELTVTLERMAQFDDDAETFYANDKIIVSTPNLDKLVASQHKSEETACALCQNVIRARQMCYKLLPCGHVFHSNKAYCLGTSTVKDWLETSRLCPCCRTEVVIS